MKKTLIFSKQRRAHSGVWTSVIHGSYFGLVTMAVLFGAMSLVAAPLKIQLPPETGTFKPAPGWGMANAQCLVCHSVEYVQMQPPKPLDFWTAEVKKMREKYGAQFPEEETPGLADYLARTYGTATNNPAPAASATNSLVSVGSQPITAEALAKKFACLSCHKVDVKVIGPAFKDVAAKYRSDPAALAKISQQIHHGGSGKWGAVIMPPFPETIITPEQTEMLGKWIMSQDTARQ